MTEPDTAAKPSRLPFIAVFLLFVIDSMGFGLLAPVYPDLITEVTGDNLSDAALWAGLLSTSFAIVQFFCAPAIGAISDRWGRRPVILISLAIMVVDYVVLIFAQSIWLLLILRLIAGATAANYAAGNAAIADITPVDKRAAMFGLLGAGFGIGFILGPVIGGFLAEYGTRAPFVAAALLTVGNMIFIYFVLPETVKNPSRKLPKLAEINPLAAYGRIMRHKLLRTLLIIILLNEIAFAVYPTIWSFYGKEMFQWSPKQIGVTLTIFGASMAFAQAVAIRLYLKFFGEIGTLIFSLALSIIMLAYMTVAQSATIVMIVLPLIALGAVMLPPVKAIMSRVTSEGTQGEMLGVIVSTASVGAIFGPIFATVSFSYFTSENPVAYMPGAPFGVAGLLMLISLVIALSIRKTVTQTT